MMNSERADLPFHKETSTNDQTFFFLCFTTFLLAFVIEVPKFILLLLSLVSLKISLFKHFVVGVYDGTNS